MKIPLPLLAPILAAFPFFQTTAQTSVAHDDIPIGYLSSESVSAALRKTLSPQGRFVIIAPKGTVRVFDTVEKIGEAQRVLTELQNAPGIVSFEINIRTGLHEVTRQSSYSQSPVSYYEIPGQPGFGGPPPGMGQRGGVGAMPPGMPVGGQPVPPVQQSVPPVRPGAPAAGAPVRPMQQPMPPVQQNVPQAQQPAPPMQPGVQRNMPPPGMSGGVAFDPPQGGYITGTEIQTQETSVEGGVNRKYTGSVQLPKTAAVPVSGKIADPAGLHDLAVRYGAVTAAEPAWTDAQTELLVAPEISGDGLLLNIVPQITVAGADGKPRQIPVTVCKTSVLLPRNAPAVTEGLAGADSEFYRLFFNAPESDAGSLTRITVAARIQYAGQPAAK